MSASQQQLILISVVHGVREVKIYFMDVLVRIRGSLLLPNNKIKHTIHSEIWFFASNQKTESTLLVALEEDQIVNESIRSLIPLKKINNKVQSKFLTSPWERGESECIKNDDEHAICDYMKRDIVMTYEFDLGCVLCNRHPESVSHLLLHCSYSRKIWNYFLESYNLQWAQSKDVASQLQAWRCRRGRRRGKKMWPVMPFAICWQIWEERNRRVMAGQRPREEAYLIKEVKATIYLWGSVDKWFWGTPFAELLTNWKVIIDADS